jgi:membrane-bound serine protease (ClpP class)
MAALRTSLLSTLVLVLCCALVRPAVPSAPSVQVGASPAGPVRAAPGATWIVIEGQLGRDTQSLLRRAIDGARARGDALVLELDTPGGSVELMWKLSRAIFAAREDDGLTVVAWVHPRALSAGALLAMSCDSLLMSSDARIGSSLPILVSPTGVAPVDEKQLSDARTGFRSVAERTGRPTALAEGMVDPGLEVRWVEVDGFPEIVSGDQWDGLRADGREVRLLQVIAGEGQLVSLTTDEALRYRLATDRAEDEGEVLSHLGLYDGAAVERIEPTSAEELASLLDSLAPFLLVIGVALIWVELQTPGLGVPALLAAACFAALLLGRYLTGLAGLEHFVVIGLGLVLIAVEFFFLPGSLWAGISGALLVLAGLIWSQLGPGLPFAHELDRQLALEAAYTTALWFGAGLLLALVMSYFLPRTPLYSRLALAPTPRSGDFGSAVEGGPEALRAQLGRLGQAVTALRPVGRVTLDGDDLQEHEAMAIDGSWPARTRVRVVAAEGGRLRVEALDPGPAAPPSAVSPPAVSPPAVSPPAVSPPSPPPIDP